MGVPWWLAMRTVRAATEHPRVRSRVTADISFLAVVRCQAASNQVVSGVRVLSRIVPAVTVAWCRQEGHTRRPRVCRHGAVAASRTGQTMPSGQRNASRYARQAASLEKTATNSR